MPKRSDVRKILIIGLRGGSQAAQGRAAIAPLDPPRTAWTACGRPAGQPGVP